MGELFWTKTPPSEDGFYWCRVPNKGVTIVMVRAITNVLYAYFPGTEASVHVASLKHAEWAGPIAQPLERH